MADTKLSTLYGSTPLTAPDLLDLLYGVDVSDTTDGAGGSSKGALLSTILGMSSLTPGSRLSLLSTHWMGADATSQYVYYTPELHDRIVLWDGTGWRLATYTQKTLDMTTVVTSQFTGNGTRSSTANGIISSISSTTGMYVGQPVTGTGIGSNAVIVTVDSSTQITLSVNNTATGTATITVYHANYDIFGYLSSNTLALEGLAWTNNTTRATALTSYSGRWCKDSAQTRLYLGSVRMLDSARVDDTFSRRFCWNMYNASPREFKVLETTDTWNYTTDAWRAANGNSANSCGILLGLSREIVRAQVHVNAYNSPSGAYAVPGIGIDSTTANSAQVRLGRAPTSITALMASYKGRPGVGYHQIYWLERSEASGTTTWHGDGGNPNTMACGMDGEVYC